MQIKLPILSACLFNTLVSIAQVEAAEDKSPFTILNPTPRSLMRDMSTDRPDQTESAYTVDAGHFQLEMDIINFTYDRHRSIPSSELKSLSLTPVNLKVGLLNNLDLQLMLEPYTWNRERDWSTASLDKAEGFGDIVTRLKYNVWGNDEGTTALAIMPFVKIPTRTQVGSHDFEGGVIVPLAISLPKDWSMGLMAEVDWIKDSDGSGYHAEFVQSITFSHQIYGKLNGYVEFYSIVSTESGTDWIGMLDAGLTYPINDNLQLDAGANFGITREAPDFNPFIGLSYRF